MRGARGEDDVNYEDVRGDPVATIENLLRWERIKLREAAQAAITALETGSLPTREYLDYMWTTDVGMKELRLRMVKLRERIAELEAIKADAALDI
ncbi:MAG: hypothetical protein NVSMB18_29300 [Acetobacteraceae bacterium]